MIGTEIVRLAGDSNTKISKTMKIVIIGRIYLAMKCVLVAIFGVRSVNEGIIESHVTRFRNIFV